ncbi:unnamed protein product [Chondrus crispus]|uniref:Uncharacterized protein n=1 Tax=Chondrus crispus TaxID=2769 RepID=R7QAC2_CHOCR|nr:unnamed protein product [Chondrus crispus]CDF34974.1 unnamed protein product [Chondrus crispus]|eukprot:XP_005714793.1 unnamed protein product [Chondrus crispus]
MALLCLLCQQTPRRSRNRRRHFSDKSGALLHRSERKARPNISRCS